MESENIQVSTSPVTVVKTEDASGDLSCSDVVIEECTVEVQSTSLDSVYIPEDIEQTIDIGTTEELVETSYEMTDTAENQQNSDMSDFECVYIKEENIELETNENYENEESDDESVSSDEFLTRSNSHCSICNQDFGTRTILNKHMTIHSLQKYKCALCNEGFSDSSTLKIHVTTHSSKKFGKRGKQLRRGPKPRYCFTRQRIPAENNYEEEEFRAENSEAFKPCRRGSNPRILPETAEDSDENNRKAYSPRILPDTPEDSEEAYRTAYNSRILPETVAGDEERILTEAAEDSQEAYRVAYNSQILSENNEDNPEGYRSGYSSRVHPDTTEDSEEASRSADALAEVPEDTPEACRVPAKPQKSGPNTQPTCPICSKTFQKRYQLQIHLTTHQSSNNTEYNCSFCGKYLSSKTSLYKHMTTVHVNEGCYKCSYCDKRFFWKSYFDRHVTVHTKEKSHHCTLCSKAFTRKLALRKHMSSTHVVKGQFCVV